MTRIPLGKVAFTDAGSYDTGKEFRKFDFITTDDSCYLSLVENNKGNALTDTTKWKCIANGKQATEAAQKAIAAANQLLEIIASAESATEQAAKQAANANAAAGSANTATDNANTIIAELAATRETLDELLPELRSAVQTARDAYDLISSTAGIDAFSRVPASMAVECVAECVVGATPMLNVAMYPRTANQSRIFQLATASGTVTPDGVVTSSEVGEVKVNVVSTQNSSLWETVTIKFRALVARTTEDGTARTTEDGTAIEC